MSEESEKEERERILDTCRDVGSKIGRDDWGDGTIKEHIPAGFGLCSTCKNFDYAEAEFGTIWARCSWFGDKCFLTGARPVTICTKHDELGKPTMKEMVDMALLIECDNKIRPGFV